MFSNFASFLAVVWTPISVAAIFLALRIFVRYKTKIWHKEDHLIVLCWLTAFVTACLATAYLEDAAFANYESSGLLMYCVLLTGTLSLALGKCSVTVALLHLLNRTGHRRQRYLIVTLSLFVAFTVPSFLLNVIPSCSLQEPPSVAPICREYNAWITEIFVLIWSFLGALIDVSYSIIAWTILRAVQIDRGEKLGLYFLLGIGWAAAPFAILRPFVSGALAGNRGFFWLCTSLEIGLMIIGASASFLMPLFQYLVTGKPITPPESNRRTGQANGNAGENVRLGTSWRPVRVPSEDSAV